MAHHISVFVENKPGKLERITGILSESRINIRAFSVASAGEFGVIKILVDDPDAACAALRQKGVTASRRAIIIAEIEDRPGGLHDLLLILSENKLNIEDSYGFILEKKNKAAVVLEVGQYPEAEKILSAKGIRTLTDAEIYAL